MKKSLLHVKLMETPNLHLSSLLMVKLLHKALDRMQHQSWVHNIESQILANKLSHVKLMEPIARMRECFKISLYWLEKMKPTLTQAIVKCTKRVFLKQQIVATPLTFDYHYLSDPVLSDNRVNATRNVFRAGEDSKNSVFCAVDGRPNDINIEYKNGKISNQIYTVSYGIDNTW